MVVALVCGFGAVVPGRALAHLKIGSEFQAWEETGTSDRVIYAGKDDAFRTKALNCLVRFGQGDPNSRAIVSQLRHSNFTVLIVRPRTASADPFTGITVAAVGTDHAQSINIKTFPRADELALLQYQQTVSNQQTQAQNELNHVNKPLQPPGRVVKYDPGGWSKGAQGGTGRGSSALVVWNPDFGIEDADPCTVLIHELRHALIYVRGQGRDRKIKGVRVDEWIAVASENKWRWYNHRPQRKKYNGHPAPGWVIYRPPKPKHRRKKKRPRLPIGQPHPSPELRVAVETGPCEGSSVKLSPAGVRDRDLGYFHVPGNTVTLTAQPGPGCAFDRWEERTIGPSIHGHDGCVENPTATTCTIRINFPVGSERSWLEGVVMFAHFLSNSRVA